MTRTMTDAEMHATKSVVIEIPGGAKYLKVKGGFWRWCLHNEEWVRLDASAVRDLKYRLEMVALEQAARTLPWHEFVCTYVAAKTAKEPVQSYSVRRAGDLWELCYMDTPQYKPMDADTMYSWFERSPLLRLSREADDFRAAVLTTRKRP